ncbi:ABC transporter permease subunit [Mumia quercus]|uniref:ABC transporter permease subunit n=1 Tax=Mumia quercus TaxID=2976125 RepID=UPI0021CFE873|nr:ABC transporter permease subunit [Mumia quercus]
MSTVTQSVPAAPEQVLHRQGFGDVLSAEWIKLRSVRSTWWTLAALVGLGAGLTVAVCWGNAEWLASAEADEPPGAFLTWGMMIAQVTAIVLGVLAVTSEYGTGMIRATFAAVPRRGRVFAAKALLVAVLLFVTGTLTALVGYLGGNYFLDREGIGLALEGDVLRAMYGSGLYMAGLGLFAVAVGTLLRHTAAAITITIAVCFVVSNMVMLIPGDVGLFLERVMPGNAGTVIATPETFNPNLLDAWPSFAIFAAEVAVLLAAAAVAVRRRDA